MTKQMNEKGRDSLFDLSGQQTGLPMNPKRTGAVLLAAGVFAIFSLLGPAFGLGIPKAGMALGLVLAGIVLWVTNQFDLVIGSLLIGVGSIVLGLIPVPDLQAKFGGSSFLTMFGMMTVSQGATHTNITKRLAFKFLHKFGKSPALILLAVCVVTGIVSAFCSNLATTVVMSSICIGILTELDEEKGKSGLGKAMMLCIPIFSMVGGMALVSGSPSQNTVGLTSLEAATNGACTITYGQWAVIGVICSVLIALPTWFIYKTIFKVSNTSDKAVDPEYFKEKLDALGPMGGSEIRWIVTVALMVGSMVAGIFTIPMASLLFGLITISPVIGTVKCKEAMKGLPLNVLMVSGMAPVIALLFKEYEIGPWLTGGLVQHISGLPVFLLILVLALILALVNNVFANATAGIIAVCVTTFAPMVVEMGYNPSLVLLPTIFMGACTVVLGAQINVVLTYDYGYWEMKDPVIPGCIICVLWTFIISVVAYFVGPMVGLSYYL
ncbi:SLC13 family permease [Lachnospiraceae bacterium 62-35]